MENNRESQVNLVRMRNFFAQAKRFEIENVRTKRLDDKEMVRQLAAGIMKLVADEGEGDGQ